MVKICMFVFDFMQKIHYFEPFYEILVIEQFDYDLCTIHFSKMFIYDYP